MWQIYFTQSNKKLFCSIQLIFAIYAILYLLNTLYIPLYSKIFSKIFNKKFTNFLKLRNIRYFYYI